MQLSKFIALSIAASGANGEFNSDGQKWTLWISDVEKTFLQGQQHKSERSGQNRIYIYIYSTSAPCMRSLTTVTACAMHPRLGTSKSTMMTPCLPPSLATALNEQQQLDCAPIVHVDDFLPSRKHHQRPLQVGLDHKSDNHHCRRIYQLGREDVASPIAPHHPESLHRSMDEGAIHAKKANSKGRLH